MDLGKIVPKPLIKLKDALKSLKNNANLNYRKTAMLNADNVNNIYNKKQDDVLIELNINF